MDNTAEKEPAVTTVAPQHHNAPTWRTRSRQKKKKTLYHVIYPSYRSQFISLALLGFLSLLAIGGDASYPGQIISQALLEDEEFRYILVIPPLSIPPLLVILKVLFSVYNCRFIIDKNGLEAQEGLLWISLRQPRIRFEDIKGIEVHQNLLQRALGIGNINIGSAAASRAEGEVHFRGVANPRKIQRRIQRAIDNRKGRLLRKTRGHRFAKPVGTVRSVARRHREEGLKHGVDNHR